MQLTPLFALVGRVLRDLLAALADLALPATCAGCGGSPAPLCPCCAATLAQPARAAPPDPAPAGLPPVFTAAAYAGAARTVIAAFKERGRSALARPLGDTLARALRLALAHPQGAAPHDATADRPSPRVVFVVPMPSRRATVRARGHDATGRLARRAVAVVRRDGVRLQAVSALRHRRAVADQAGLDAFARAVNLAGALEVPRRHQVLLAGRVCLLVDDVVTTGASLAEAARALRAAGAVVPAAAVVAATPRRSHSRDITDTPAFRVSDGPTTVSAWHPPGSVVASGRPARAGPPTSRSQPQAKRST